MNQGEPEQLPAAAAVRLLIKFIREEDHPQVEGETVQSEGPRGHVQERGGRADRYESEGVSQGHPPTQVWVSHGHHPVA